MYTSLIDKSILNQLLTQSYHQVELSRLTYSDTKDLKIVHKIFVDTMVGAI